MGFECPNQFKGYCQLNEAECTPTKGKCVLAGKVKLLNTSEEENTPQAE